MATQQRRALVLNVNDNEAGRYTATMMLRRGGFDVVEAATGHEALATIEAQRPDVVVLDVRLPDIDGLEVCRRIRADARIASTKILCTSATFVTIERRVQGLENGADGYLTQPFEAAELIAIVRSLSRLADAEREMRARADHLADADRKKDEFLAMLAHELRNPLAAIVTSLPVLERRPAFDAVETRAREAMRRQVAHLVRLVDDLLDVSRVTHGKIELRNDLVDLRALLERVSSVVRRQKLELSLTADAVHVRGDPTRLEQVFTNLLDNASKYSDNGGRIAVSLTRDGAKATVVVRDDGIGIDPSSLASVFDLFVQGRVPRGGLGIGLTLVRTLVEMHGGVVVAASEGAGKGSAFTVELPMVLEEPAVEPVTPSKPSTRRSVLIIEDNADAQWAMRDLLEAWGHHVKVAGDGGSGVKLALTEKFDFALVDIGLPGMDGYEVARQLRSVGQKPFLVALTGYARRDEAIAAGFDLHIVKPISAAMLESLLEREIPAARNEAHHEPGRAVVPPTTR